MLDRFVREFGHGDGAPALANPDFVDCNGVCVAVSEWEAEGVCVLSYADGSLVGRIGGDVFRSPRGILLLADGSGVVVADSRNHRVVLLSLASGAAPLVTESHAELRFPCGIVQYDAPNGDVAVVVTCQGAAGRATRLMKIGFRSGVCDSVDMAGSADWQFSGLAAVATLPEGGVVALDFAASRFQVFTSLALRMRWLRLAESWQRQLTPSTARRRDGSRLRVR